MGAENNQPDWDKIAEKFDIWLPQLKPVGDALLQRLDTQTGDHVIDLGSGTGEPALSLARRLKNQIKITGIDSADGMVKVAQKKVLAESLSGIEFITMPSENILFPDNHFDRALCRFGLMLFEDPLKGLQETHRVLKSGGKFAFAVWGTAESMRTLFWSYQAFKDHIDEEYYPPLTKVTSLGAPGIVEELFESAGFTNYMVERMNFNYEFQSFDEYWNAVEASDILKMQYDALPPEKRDGVRDEVGRFARDFINDGMLTIPHEYLVISGYK